MENTLEVAPEAPQAPMGASQQQPAVGQPPQMGGQPPVAPDGNLEQTQGAEAPPEPEFQFELPSGTRYRTTEDLVRGATEKDFAIERYKAELAELRARVNQPQPQQAAAPDPQAQATQAIEALQREIEMEYRSDPRFQGYSPEQIAEQAYIDAKREYRAEQRAFQKIQEQQQKLQQEQQEQQWREFERTTPDLQTPLAQHLWEKSVQEGRPYPSPHALLDAVHAEMYRRGMQPSQPQAGGMQAAQTATQQHRPVFNGMGGTGAAPGATGAIHPIAQKQIEFAQAQGYTGEALERIKQRAIADAAKLEGLKR